MVLFSFAEIMQKSNFKASNMNNNNMNNKFNRLVNVCSNYIEQGNAAVLCCAVKGFRCKAYLSNG